MTYTCITGVQGAVTGLGTFDCQHNRVGLRERRGSESLVNLFQEGGSQGPEMLSSPEMVNSPVWAGSRVLA